MRESNASAFLHERESKGDALNAQNKPAFDHSGSTFDSFLEEEGILNTIDAVALQRVSDWKVSGVQNGASSSGDSFFQLQEPINGNG
ncbi:hypothetical protein [Terracidiphilus sp.]|uniref:hypothetical protein n=1 Tax=Terracidiphilus sp. TaxID=1964191 RepID=UPI003C1AAA43